MRSAECGIRSGELAGDPVITLSVETSGRIGGVALARGPAILEVVEFSAALRHAVALVPTADALCRRHGVRPHEIEEVYVSVGPGSFTGLRLGVTFAKTLALAGTARLVGVPTLDAIAQGALAFDNPPHSLGVVLDAKRGHVYAAAYRQESESGIYAAINSPAECDPAVFLADLPRDAAVVGEGIPFHQAAVAASGLHILPESFHRSKVESVFQLGRRAARAGRFDDAMRLGPTYIRRPEAEEVYERRNPA